MRVPIYGTCRSGKTIFIYLAGTSTPAQIYTESAGGSPVSSIPGNDDGVVFWVDDATYPFPAFFDLKIVAVDEANQWIYGVWSSFFSEAPTDGSAVVVSNSPFSLGAIRTRLATFYALDETQTQVKAVLNECIQTGYEKVVSIMNNHAQQKTVTIGSVANQYSYTNNSMGIPTFVGYGPRRLKYLPYEDLRAAYGNFEDEWDTGDPLYYSLVGFNGLTKTLLVVPSPKETGDSITVLCFQVPSPLVNDSDFPLVPTDWAWLVLERAKVERLRFEREFELYQIQAQEFVAYIKAMINRIYPTTPQTESGFVRDPDMVDYNSWRSRRI
jgi:hypothetical protein